MISHLGHTIIQIRAVTGKTSQADKQAETESDQSNQKKMKEQAEKHCSNSDK